MTIALTASLVLLTIGFLILLDRKDARAHARQERHDQQVERLCQRIQAPELAVIRHDAEQATEEPAGAAPILDEEFFREHQEAAEHIARLEALENAQFDRA